MARSTEEWKATHDDQAIPPRVKLRIWKREKGICSLSGRKIQPGEPYDFEHRVALCNGGEHVESNIVLALRDKHKEKTARDRAEKKIIDRKAKKNGGIGKPKHRWPSRPMSRPHYDNTKRLNADLEEKA
jgi:5-methylcytosine-specific restriction enzyme A